MHTTINEKRVMVLNDYPALRKLAIFRKTSALTRRDFYNYASKRWLPALSGIDINGEPDEEIVYAFREG